MSILDYKPADVPKGCKLRISPSGFSTFIDKPHNWYRKDVLNEVLFDYNTSSVIGTIVHYCAEMYARGEEIDKDAINEYIEKHDPKEDYEPEVVKDNWYEMAHTLINGYVAYNLSKYSMIEQEVCAEVAEGIYAAGSLDVLEGDKKDAMPVDYKTYNSKTKPKTIPAAYKYQLLVYSWILMKLGYEVTRIRLVYVNRRINGGISEKTGKPLKSYPCEVTVLTESITEEDLTFIESLLGLCAESYEAAVKHPELTHVIFHDPRLKVT